MTLIWKEKKNPPGAVYYATLVGEAWSPTLGKSVPDFVWGMVSKASRADKFLAWNSIRMETVGLYYHKTRAKKAVVASVVEQALMR